MIGECFELQGYWSRSYIYKLTTTSKPENLKTLKPQNFKTSKPQNLKT